jgi:hypothetical protein
VLLSCCGVIAFVACGADECEKSLSCIERSRDEQDSGDSGTPSVAADADIGNGGTGSGNSNGNDGGPTAGAGNAEGGEAGRGSVAELDASHDAGPEEPPPPPVCGVNPVVGCVASTQDAVFVSAGVDESGDGSQASPVKTIAEGIELARTQDATRIVVCNGIYQEAVVLTIADSGRSLAGGYNCDSWLYNPDGETLARPTERGYALNVSGTTQRVTISNFTFDAMAAMDPGESSIAAFIVNASEVRLTRVRLIAHEGQAATQEVTHDFVAGVTNEWPADTDLIGNDGLQQSLANDPHFVGGARAEVTCPGGGVSRSGKGGGKPNDPNGEAGEVGQLPVGKGGQGGALNSQCDTCLSNVCGCVVPAAAGGLQGDDGADGGGAVEQGSVSADGWQVASGETGEIGGPGGGGGGGDGAWQACGVGGDSSWFGGGGGGAGGCGGNGGVAGGGGGSSISLAILDSQVELTACDLIAADAGTASSGDVGQDGQMGGAGGDGIGGNGGYSVPCDGGPGGKGGSGGKGGGGAGGSSLGVAWAGIFEPTIGSDTTTALGNPGTGGVGGEPGNNDGIDGVAQEVLEVPAG